MLGRMANGSLTWYAGGIAVYTVTVPPTEVEVESFQKDKTALDHLAGQISFQSGPIA
jgi:hypothetical protein